MVDKYYTESNSIACHQNILNKLLNSFDTHKDIYNNFSEIKCNKNKVIDTINYIQNKSFQYSNFQHLIFYGPDGCGKKNSY